MGNEQSKIGGGGVIFNQTQQTIYYAFHKKDEQPFQKIRQRMSGLNQKFGLNAGCSIQQQRSRTKQELSLINGVYELRSKRISTMGLKFDGDINRRLSIITEKGQFLLKSAFIDRAQQLKLIIDKDFNVKKIRPDDAEKLMKIGQTITAPSVKRKTCTICNNEEEAIKNELVGERIVCTMCQSKNRINYICKAYPLHHVVCVHCYNSHKNLQMIADIVDKSNSK